MLARYQKGCLQRIVRKDGVERWQFRWLRKGADGVAASVVKHSHEGSHPANSSKAGYPEEDLLAYVPAHILFRAQREW